MFQLPIVSAKKVLVTGRRGSVFPSIALPIQIRLPKIPPLKGYSRVPWATEMSSHPTLNQPTAILFTPWSLGVWFVFILPQKPNLPWIFRQNEISRSQVSLNQIQALPLPAV